MSSVGKFAWFVALALALPLAAVAQDQEAEQPATATAQEGVAQEPPSDAEPAKVVEEDGKRVFEDQLVVTASRQEESSADIPAPITVIDRQMIEQTQPEKMADLFKQIPGVEIDGEGPFRGLPVIRGFSSNRVLILVDGQRLNNARESTSFAGIQPGLVNLSEVERIEVLRGPASVQYGSDAIGGVVNIITRAPDLGAVGRGVIACLLVGGTDLEREALARAGHVRGRLLGVRGRAVAVAQIAVDLELGGAEVRRARDDVDHAADRVRAVLH